MRIKQNCAWRGVLHLHDEHARTIKAKQTDRQRRIGPQNREENREREYAAGDPGDLVAVLANLRLDGDEVGRGHQSDSCR